MIEYLLIWLVTPILLLLLSFGFGVLLSILTKRPMNMVVCLAAGFSLLVIFGSFLGLSNTLAPHVASILGVIALFGLLISGVRFRSYIRIDSRSGLAGLITYLSFGLPVMAYGHPSWAGWVQLDDTASWFAVTNRLMSVGRSTPTSVLSTFDRLIQITFSGNVLNYGGVTGTHFSYPLGAFIPFGTVSKISGLELAWIFQPFLSFAAALSGMLLVLFYRKHTSSKYMQIGLSVLTMMASTIYSYVMWGGIKEIVLIVPLLMLSYILFSAFDDRFERASYLYAAIGVLAIYFIAGSTSLGFTAPILLVAILLKVRAKSQIVFYSSLFVVAALSMATIIALKVGNNPINRMFVPEIKDSGNLIRSLNLTQTMGIWPSRDFRLDPVFPSFTYFVIAVAFCFLAIGIFYSAKKGMWAVPVLVATCAAVVIYSYFFAGVWITGKAIAVASPIFLLTSMIGIVESWKLVRRSKYSRIGHLKVEHLVLFIAAIIGFTVVLSDFYTYRNVWIAPYSQMNELKTIDKLYSGQGPALMTEYSVFGARYFLRDLEAESASELRVHPIPMSDGTQVPKGFAADISLFDPNVINYYKILVLRKSPVSSRPPLNYQLVWSGEHYEVWKRSDTAPVIKKIMSLGNNFTPGSTPDCRAVDTFLADRAKTDKIYTVVRDKTYLISFSNGDLPTGWIPSSTLAGAVDHSGSGGFSRAFAVDRTDFYNVSLAGSFPGRLRLLIDGNQVFSGHSVFEGNPTLTNTLTKVHIAEGEHVLTLIYSSPILMPGSDAITKFGPLYLSTQFAGDTKVQRVSNSRIPQLCKENLDWIATTN